MTKKYRIEVTEEHLGLITDALDMYCRIGIGQGWAVADEITWNYLDVRNDENYSEKRDNIKNLIDLAFQICFGFNVRHESYGIYNKQVKDKYNTAYELHKKIDKCIWDNTEDAQSFSVKRNGTLYNDLNGEFDIECIGTNTNLIGKKEGVK